MVERILILTPPGLVQQWREELVQKFGLHDFVTNSDDAFRAAGDDAWFQFPRVIASIAANSSRCFCQVAGLNSARRFFVFKLIASRPRLNSNWNPPRLLPALRPSLLPNRS